jgi:hypothetical protein
MNSENSQTTPIATWVPWKPVSVKNDEPNRLRDSVSPSWLNS